MNFIINHVAGSCGDLLCSPIASDNNFLSPIFSQKLLQNGRLESTLDNDFLKIFPKQNFKHWYTRNWENDWDKLLKFNQNWMILVMDPTQVLFLKEKLKDNVCTISISYQENNWEFVADSFCHKVLDSPNYLTRDDVGENFLNNAATSTENRNWFIELGNRGLLGEWYKKQLKKGVLTYPPKQYYLNSDITVSLDLLFQTNGLLNVFNKIESVSGYKADQKFIKNIHKKWLAKQNFLKIIK